MTLSPELRHRLEIQDTERLESAALLHRIGWSPGRTAADLHRSIHGHGVGIGATLRRLDLLAATGKVARIGQGWHPGPNFSAPARPVRQAAVPEPVQVPKPAPAPRVAEEPAPTADPVLALIRKRPGHHTVDTLADLFGVAGSTMRKRVGLLRAAGVVSEHRRDIMPIRALVTVPISHVTPTRAEKVYAAIGALTSPATCPEVSALAGVNDTDVTRVVAALRRLRCVSEAGSLWPMR